MIRRFTAKLSYADVMATVAVFLALGGTSYALTVTGRQVQNSSLTGADVRNSSLTGADVRNGSLRATDFAAGQLRAGLDGVTGPAGPAGPAGASGARGAQGARGADGVDGAAGADGADAASSGWRVLSNHSFRADEAGEVLDYSEACVHAADGHALLFGDLGIPAGTRVTKVDAFIFDTAAGLDGARLDLMQHTLPTGTGSTRGHGESTGDGGMQTVTITPTGTFEHSATGLPILDIDIGAATPTTVRFCGAVVYWERP